jgi:hypothetical protein
VSGKNYLVPVDAKLEDATGLDFEMVQLDVIHRIMERQTSTNILFLDACRNNPLARNLARAMGTRSADIGRGLAVVESGVGTLISFSTQPGNVATDGLGRNSPFAGALVKQIANSTDSLGDILIAVRNDVRSETKGKQVPWEHSALTGRFYFNAAPNLAVVNQAVVPGAPKETDDRGRSVISALSEQETNRIKSLAGKHQLVLPDIQIDTPGPEVPAGLRRFVGVWIDETGGPFKAKKHMLIVSRVTPEGKAEGIFGHGPPTASSFDKEPAGFFEISGTISEGNLNFTNPRGTQKYRLELAASGDMNYHYANATGQKTSRPFKKVWTSVDVERVKATR